MEDSSFIDYRVRPVLAEILALDEDDQRRDPDRLFAEVRRLSDVVLVGEGHLSVQEACELLGRCAGLLLAIRQPYAPPAPRDQQTDLLTDALRVEFLTYAPNDIDELEYLDDELDDVEEMLEKLRDDPTDFDDRAQLIDDLLGAAATCVTFADAAIGVLTEEFNQARNEGAKRVLKRRRKIARWKERH